MFSKFHNPERKYHSCGEYAKKCSDYHKSLQHYLNTQFYSTMTLRRT